MIDADRDAEIDATPVSQRILALHVRTHKFRRLFFEKGIRQLEDLKRIRNEVSAQISTQQLDSAAESCPD